ncbi:MAG: 4Fe-4S dicluster domain-containing protein [Chloroflexi bacterium]|nr:4Fe-4S dicluster domain-containing protein [Chloroflexota bacterium]
MVEIGSRPPGTPAAPGRAGASGETGETSAASSGQLSRRGLFGGTGVVGAAAVAGMAAAAGVVTWLEDREAEAAAPPPSPPPGGSAGTAQATRQWVLVFDLRKCEGCVTQDKPPQCAEACNAEHFVPAGQQWLRVFRVEAPGGNSYFMPRPCMQCENAPCLNVCPVAATYRNAEGVILIDHNRCIGCRMCMAACPYGARSFNWSEPENPPGATFAQYRPEYPVPHRRGTVEKCMLCAHRTKDGKLPACAAGCPMNAVYLGDLVEDSATNGKEVVKLSRFLAENGAFRLKEELGTRPRVWYVRGHGQEYGRPVDDRRLAKEPRAWQELQKEQKKEASSASHTTHMG